MLLAHFAYFTTARDPGWLQALDNMADGRAAPLFCVLLGVGAGLYLRRRSPYALVWRGLLLFGIGLAVWPHVERVYLILPQYGVILAVVAACARIPSRWLLGLAAACWVVPSTVVALVDGHGLRAASQPDTYGDLVDVGHIAWQILWSGGYPIVGWTGFAFVGLYVSRLRLADRGVQARLLGAGVAVAALQPLTAVAFAALDGERKPRDAGGLAAFLDGTAHSNQLAWYVLASASAVAVIAGCLLLAGRVPLAPLAVVGQNVLSLYLLHLLIGAVAVWPWIQRARPALVAQVAVALATAAAFAALAALWSRYFGRGPVETLLRLLVR